MQQIGAQTGITAQGLTATIDGQGNPIISNDTAFGASPAGSALLTQQLFGLANATFNLTPPNIYEQIGPGNEVPYWSWIEYSDGTMTATVDFDVTTQNWGIIIDPGTALSGDYCTLTTRSYLINDDNLALRQRALSVISKSGTAGGTASQWNLTLSATYYDATDTALSTAFIGTALDTGTWTSFAGTTTPGGSAINSAARYVDLQYKLTATANITGSAKVTIKSTLLQSSAGGGGAQSFVVVETFTSSGTWTVPTGVSSVLAVVGVGAGGGGAGGSLQYATSGTAYVTGSGGGGGAAWSILRDISLGTATSVSIGIGAGGAGGTAAVGTANAAQTKVGGNGATGGSTTFGTYVTWTGGNGGTAVTPGTASATGGAGGTSGSATSSYYGFATTIGTAGAVGGSTFIADNGASAGSVGNSVPAASQLIYPYTTFTNLGSNSGSASAAGWGNDAATRTSVGAIGTAGTVAFFGAGGGGGGAAWAKGQTTTQAVIGAAGGNGATYGSSGAGGPAMAAFCNTTNQFSTTRGGNGGAGGANTGCGGGAGGAVAVRADQASRFLGGTAGAGGDGSTGFVAVVYVG